MPPALPETPVAPSNVWRDGSLREAAGRGLLDRIASGFSAVHSARHARGTAEIGDRAVSMSSDASRRFLAVLTARVDGEALTLTTLCRRVLELLPASGVSVVLMSRRRDQVLTGAFGVMAAELQDLEFTLGEGPGTDAFASDTLVVHADVSAGASLWPQFVPLAVANGLRSVSALPLQVGAIKLGVLVLYGDRTRRVETEDLADTLLVGDLVTHLVLAMQSESASDSVAWALEVSDHRAVVHQATGVLSVRLGCTVEEALMRLRGRAFASGQSIDDLAQEVVAGDARFD